MIDFSGLRDLRGEEDRLTKIIADELKAIHPDIKKGDTTGDDIVDRLIVQYGLKPNDFWAALEGVEGLKQYLVAKSWVMVWEDYTKGCKTWISEVRGKPVKVSKERTKYGVGIEFPRGEELYTRDPFGKPVDVIEYAGHFFELEPYLQSLSYQDGAFEGKNENGDRVMVAAGREMVLAKLSRIHRIDSIKNARTIREVYEIMR